MINLVMSPRDGMFLKDGREWAASEGGRAHSLGWPAPSTLLGALCTASGRLQEAAGRTLAPRDWKELEKATVLGPSVALRRSLGGSRAEWTPAERVWPVPADALFLADEAGKAQQVLRLDPLPPRYETLGRDDDTRREALWWPRVEDAAKPARAPSWWSEAALAAWLGDPAPKRPCEGAFRGLALPRHVQAHVSIDPATEAAREGILFAHDVIEMLDGNGCEWAIGCQVTLAGGVLVQATLGGDRRFAGIAVGGTDLFAVPPGLEAAFAAKPPKGLRLVAITPAAFEAGWRPDGFAAADDNTYRGRLPGIEAELILRAAFVPRATHVSGWDMAERRPKPTTRLVPPGAVYHFIRVDGGTFPAAAAERLWLTKLGERTAQGFGRFVPGVWYPEEQGT
jgi:CRISPR-associated protein Cmr3